MADIQNDYYETLQVSINADPDTIHRLFRILAQRFHPDNQQTGDPEQFRMLTEAYEVLSDPTRRAEYDVHHGSQRRERSRLLAEMVRVQSDVEFEHLARVTVLEALYARRRLEPRNPGIWDGDLEELVGRPREQLEFTLWYLSSKGLIDRQDGSRLTITVDGVAYFEEHCAQHRKLLQLAAPGENTVV